jgi:hypothetical protein
VKLTDFAKPIEFKHLLATYAYELINFFLGGLQTKKRGKYESAINQKLMGLVVIVHYAHTGNKKKGDSIEHPIDRKVTNIYN